VPKVNASCRRASGDRRRRRDTAAGFDAVHGEVNPLRRGLGHQHLGGGQILGAGHAHGQINAPGRCAHRADRDGSGLLERRQRAIADLLASPFATS